MGWGMWNLSVYVQRPNPFFDEMDLPFPLLHLLPQTERPHVGPHLFDMRQTFCHGPAFACIGPAKRIFLVCRPDRVLLFMIQNDFVDSIVLRVVGVH